MPFSEFSFVNDKLKELGLDDLEIEEVLSRVNPLIREMYDRQDKYLKQALKEICRTQQTRYKRRLMNLVGSDLFDRSDLGEPRRDQLEICEETRPQMQLILAWRTDFPKGNELSDDQLQSLEVLRHKELEHSVKNKGENRDQLIRKELSEILTPAQRVAVIRGIHERALRADITWLTTTPVLNYLDTTEAEADLLKTKVMEYKEAIDKTRKLAEENILQEGLKTLTKERRSTVSPLVEDVWK